VARPKKIEEAEETIVQSDVSFDFFKQEVEKEGVQVMTADKVNNPKPNFSGSFSLDYDLVVPFPEGRVTEVYGEEGTCKTTLVLEVIGRACQGGKKCLYVNMEKNLNRSLMYTIRSLRPFLDQALANAEASDKNKKLPFPECPFWVANASNGEQALETMRKFASMVPNGVAALDSIDAAQPSAVLSGEIGEQKVGNLAKLMSDAMHKMVGVAEQNRVAIVLVNQTRDKITMYGDPTTTPGGKAVKFYASQRIQLKKPRNADQITNAAGDKIGLIIRYVIVKNKLAPDGNEGAFPILLKNGIFREQELITQCCNFGLLRMGGKGGKQVLLPKINRDTNEFITKDGEIVTTCMSQFNAACRLLMDNTLTGKLSEMLLGIINDGGYDPMTDLVDEVSNPE
jgi:recombination protein RecA